MYIFMYISIYAYIYVCAPVCIVLCPVCLGGDRETKLIYRHVRNQRSGSRGHQGMDCKRCEHYTT